MPVPTTPIKVKIKGIFNTFLSITISGSDRPITAIINANAVPSDAPFSIKTETIGTIPAAFEYNGIPIIIDNGTEYQADFPISAAIKSSGTYPCAPAPTAIPNAT